MIRLYAEADGRLRFAGKDPEAERLAARALKRERGEFEERRRRECRRWRL